MSATRRHVLLAVAAAWLGSARGQERYRTAPPSADGTGRFYIGREIAGVMGWQGADWLERSERAREEGADQLVREPRLAPGMVVADVGAGTGFYTRRIA